MIVLIVNLKKKLEKINIEALRREAVQVLNQMIKKIIKNENIVHKVKEIAPLIKEKKSL
jgi:hypothetical protein